MTKGRMEEPNLRELRRSVDPVYLSAAQALLRAEGLSPLILDDATSALEGSILAIPRRLMVADEEHYRARLLLDAWDAAHG